MAQFQVEIVYMLRDEQVQAEAIPSADIESRTSDYGEAYGPPV